MKKIVVGNQKAYLLKNEVLDFIEKTKGEHCKDVVICPSSIYLPLYQEHSSFLLGSQDVSCQDGGTCTGEVLAKQLKSMNVCYAIVGHSERRMYLHESSSMLTSKIKQLLKEGIIPIFCVGEGKKEKEEGVTKDFVGKEILDVFSSLSQEDISRVIVAYEPIWAISTGGAPSVTPSKEEIIDIVQYIKDLVRDRYDVSLEVLYGGSVNPENVVSFNEMDIVDGYLIGGASVKPEQFRFIIDACCK